MRRTSLGNSTAAAVLLTLLVACAEPPSFTPPPAPPAHPYQLWFGIPDLASKAAHPLRLLMTGPLDMPQELLTATQHSVKVVDLKTGGAVPFTFDAPSVPEQLGGLPTIALVIDTSVQTDWMFVGVTDVPDKVGTSLLLATKYGSGVRVNPSSALTPRALQATLLADSPSLVTVSLWFNGPVEFDEGIEPVSMEVQGKPCERRPLAEDGPTAVVFDCTLNGFDPLQEVAVNVESGIHSWNAFGGSVQPMRLIDGSDRFSGTFQVKDASAQDSFSAAKQPLGREYTWAVQ